MHPRSTISLSKLISRYPFTKSPIPTSSISPKSLTTISNQCVLDLISPPNFNKTHHFLTQQSSNPSTHFRIFPNLRQFSVDPSKEVDEINLKFAEARDEIEMALESKDTVYFDEEAECARTAVTEVLDLYNGLLSKLPESEKSAIQRSMGLKIEQLKAELQQLNE